MRGAALLFGCVLLLLASCASLPTGPPSARSVEEWDAAAGELSRLANGPVIDGGPLVGRRSASLPVAVWDNVVQTQGIRVGFPEGWRAYSAADAISDGAVVMLADTGSSHRVRVDHFSFAQPIDPGRFTTLAVERSSASLVDEDGTFQTARLVFQGRPLDVVTHARGTIAIMYGETEVWMIESLKERGAISNAERLAFFSLVASFEPVAPQISVRVDYQGASFFGLDGWEWVWDTEEGFDLTAPATAGASITEAEVTVEPAARSLPGLHDLREYPGSARFDRIAVGKDEESLATIVLEADQLRLLLRLFAPPEQELMEPILDDPAVAALVHACLLIGRPE